VNETVTELMRFPSGLRPDHGQTVSNPPWTKSGFITSWMGRSRDFSTPGSDVKQRGTLD